jgi:hypothetical protein
MQETIDFPRTRQGVRDLDILKKPMAPVSGGPAPTQKVNVGSSERILSAVGGTVLAAYGLSQFTPFGLALMALGGSLIFRGTTGHCAMYSAFGLNTVCNAAQDKCEHAKSPRTGSTNFSRT